MGCLDRQGALSLTTIDAGRCMPTGPADLAIAPDLECVRSVDMAILQARLSLRPSGRVLLHFTPGPADVVRHAEARLRDNGFAPSHHLTHGRAMIAARLQDTAADLVR